MTNNLISTQNNRTYLCLLALVFMVTLGYGVALPILPYLLERLLVDSGRFSTSTHIGTITGIYAFSMFLFAPLWGRLSDKVGRRPVLLLGLGGFVVMLGLFGLSPNLEFAYASRILGGLFASSILPVSSAYIADMSSPELRAGRFAWMGTAGLLGFLAGPMLGGWLSDVSGQWLSFFGGRMGVSLVSMPFLAAAALGAAVWVLTYLLMARHAGDAAVSPATGTSFKSQDAKSIKILLLLTFLLTFALGSFEVGLSLHGQQNLDLGPARLSQMFVTCMLVMIGSQVLVFPYLIKRCPIHYIAPPAFAAMSVGLVFLPMALDFGRLLIVVGLVATGSGLLAPIMSYRISLAAGTKQGAVLGKQAAASNLGQAIGAVTTGFGFGFMKEAPFWVAAVILVIGAGLSIRIPLLSMPPAANNKPRF